MIVYTNLHKCVAIHLKLCYSVFSGAYFFSGGNRGVRHHTE